MTIKLRVVSYVPVEINRSELITLTEAATMLDMSKSGVISAIERGVYKEYIDESAAYHGRRLLLRSEVVRSARERDEGDMPA